jgi:hypothetical protein
MRDLKRGYNIRSFQDKPESFIEVYALLEKGLSTKLN